MASFLGEVSLGFFSLIPDRAGGGLTVRLRGTADMRAMETLDAFLRQIHEEAKSRTLAEVAVDLRSLEFMNSSCFKAFVAWIENDLSLPEAQRYRLRFISSAERRWQHRSLVALSCFATELIDLEE